LEEEAEKKEKKAFRRGVATSMERLSYASVQDSLRLARKQALELEIKWLDATNERRKEAHKKMLDLEKANVKELKKHVDFMNTKLQTEMSANGGDEDEEQRTGFKR